MCQLKPKLFCWLCTVIRETSSINTMEALQDFRDKVLINQHKAECTSDPLRVSKVFSVEQFQRLWQSKGFCMLNSTAIFVEWRQRCFGILNMGICSCYNRVFCVVHPYIYFTCQNFTHVLGFEVIKSKRGLFSAA